MKLYECNECGEYYYKKVKECPYCECNILLEIEGTDEEVILSALKELYFEEREYEQFNIDEIKKEIEEKIGNNFKYMSFSRALDTAEELGLFTKMTLYHVNS